MSPRVTLVIGALAVLVVVGVATWPGAEPEAGSGTAAPPVELAPPAPGRPLVPVKPPPLPPTPPVAVAREPEGPGPTSAPMAPGGAPMAPIGAIPDAGPDEWEVEAANVSAAARALEEAMRSRGAK